VPSARQPIDSTPPRVLYESAPRPEVADWVPRLFGPRDECFPVAIALKCVPRPVRLPIRGAATRELFRRLSPSRAQLKSSIPFHPFLPFVCEYGLPFCAPEICERGSFSAPAPQGGARPHSHRGSSPLYREDLHALLPFPPATSGLFMCFAAAVRSLIFSLLGTPKFFFLSKLVYHRANCP